MTERDAGLTLSVVERQLKAVLERLDSEDAARIVVAYEPVWAIGTGRSASADEAQQSARVDSAAVAGVDSSGVGGTASLWRQRQARQQRAAAESARHRWRSGRRGIASMQNSFGDLYYGEAVMETIILIIHVLLGVALVALVLIQQGKGRLDGRFVRCRRIADGLWQHRRRQLADPHHHRAGDGLLCHQHQPGRHCQNRADGEANPLHGLPAIEQGLPSATEGGEIPAKGCCRTGAPPTLLMSSRPMLRQYRPAVSPRSCQR